MSDPGRTRDDLSPHHEHERGLCSQRATASVTDRATTRALLLASMVAFAGTSWVQNGDAQEAVTEKVRVEASFTSSLQLERDPAVTEIVTRLQFRAEADRARDLKEANESVITRLLDLTRHIPIELGSSENKVDTFFLQNYMRADLNPRADDPLSLRK